MFFVLSKVLSFLIQPLNWTAVLIILAIFFPKKKLRKKFLWWAAGLFFFFSNPLLINQAFRWWEYPPTKMADLQESYEVAVILGGYTSTLSRPRDRLHFNKGVDRLSNGLELYFQGKVNKLLLTGATSRLLGEKISESYTLEKYLARAGFPPDRLLIEGESKNTWQNALRTKELLTEKYESLPRVLLITSAFHMKRSIGCFEKAGLDFVPFATDYFQQPLSPSPMNWLLPDPRGFWKWKILIKEWVGIVAYKLAGYN